MAGITEAEGVQMRADLTEAQRKLSETEAARDAAIAERDALRLSIAAGRQVDESLKSAHPTIAARIKSRVLAEAASWTVDGKLDAGKLGEKIAAGAALSFLGFGAPPPAPEWGSMLSVGRNYLANAVWLVIAPGATITLTVLAITSLGRELVARSEGVRA